MLQEDGNEYSKALEMGQREYKELTAAGKNPYPAVLDEILGVESGAVQEISLVDVPMERIVGVKSASRSNSFTASFLPLLEKSSEFAQKWSALCKEHLSDTGIRDPILCYEYLGDFYVQEGNKRVSVLRYFGAPSIAATVRRVLPKKSDEPRIKAYYEFLDFYRDTKLYDIQFTKPGEYAKLLSFLGKKSGEAWTEDERRMFSSRYHYFKEAFVALGGRKDQLRVEDALLLWLQVYSFAQLGEMTAKDLKKSLAGLWGDVVTSSDEEAVKVKTIPEEEPTKGIIGRLFPLSSPTLNVAFLYQQDPKTSIWTRGHDLGRQHLEQVFQEQVKVRSYYHADSPEETEQALNQAVQDGAQLVFTTTPLMLRQTLKAAVSYPKVRFLNCSMDTHFSSVRSYYCRVFEGKFITGAIAGAMAEDDRIGYVESYPILGVPASINAFALGAQMTNPRAQIYLDWSCLPGNPVRRLLDQQLHLISNRDIPAQGKHYLEYGTYGTYLVQNGILTPLASPCWVWGRLYENVVQSVLQGTWQPGKSSQEAVNYWWGFDSGVVDVELSPHVPEGPRALTKLLVSSLKAGLLHPFSRRITAQDGSVKNDGTKEFDPKELLHMDWLCENVKGSIPSFDELIPESQALVREMGITPPASASDPDC